MCVMVWQDAEEAGEASESIGEAAHDVSIGANLLKTSMSGQSQLDSIPSTAAKVRTRIFVNQYYFK